MNLKLNICLSGLVPLWVWSKAHWLLLTSVVDSTDRPHKNKSRFCTLVGYWCMPWMCCETRMQKLNDLSCPSSYTVCTLEGLSAITVGFLRTGTLKHFHRLAEIMRNCPAKESHTVHGWVRCTVTTALKMYSKWDKGTAEFHALFIPHPSFKEKALELSSPDLL